MKAGLKGWISDKVTVKGNGRIKLKEKVGRR
jgi:hypothetical protein